MNSTNGVYGLFIGLFALAITGCSTVAPNYSPSIDNVEAIKAAGIQKANVGSITETPQLNKISLRGSSMTSPISGSYGAYLADAIRQEFDLAKTLDPNSAIEISGGLVKNDVDVTGFSVGSAVIEAHILVKKSGVTKYDKTVAGTIEFPSSFLGPVAIPAGINSYPTAVRKFLATLYADPDFVAALK